MFLPAQLTWAIIAFSALTPIVHAFSFTVGTPTQCDNLILSWTGGAPPYKLLLLPLYGSFRNISIPSEAFTDGKGSYSMQLPFQQGQRFVVTMSDATGFASGGSTNILTTGASQGGNCNTIDPGVDFPFQLNSALQQCRPYVFSEYSKAVQPVTIIGTIPGGTSFILNPPTGPLSFEWKANVANGTSIVFTMVDSQGRNGGSSDAKVVGITDDATCLNNLSPSSTTVSPTSTSATTTPPSHTSTTTTSPTAEPKNNTSIAAIAGTVIGSLVFLAVAITLGLFCLRKKRGSGVSFGRRSRRMQSEVDLTYEPTHPGTYPYPSETATVPSSFLPGGNPYDSNPFLDSPHPQQPSLYVPSQYQPPSHYHQSSRHQQHLLPVVDPDPFNPYTGYTTPSTPVEPPEHPTSDQSSRDSMTTVQRKAAMAGISSYTPSRFIVHTDVEDELPPPNGDGIVELPPQYSERRGPLGVPSLPHASGTVPTGS